MSAVDGISEIGALMWAIIMAIYSFKIVYLGDPSVGKTSLRRRFMGLSFNETYLPTIGVDISVYNLKVDTNVLKFILYDLAGQVWFRDVRKDFYVGANGAFVIFDLTNYQSFYNVSNWIKEYWKNTKWGNPFILIGNKKDLVDQRQVPLDIIEGYIYTFEEKTGYRIDYIETSAKTGENVVKAFNSIVKKIAIYKRKSSNS